MVSVAVDEHDEVVRVADDPPVRQALARPSAARRYWSPSSPPGCHGACRCSSSTDSAMLASSGDRMPPCGVPVSVSSTSPSSVRIPALRNALTSRSTRLSLTRGRTRSIRAVWSMRVKARLDVRVQHPAVTLGAEHGGSRRSRRVRAARAGTRRRPARSRPRRSVPAPVSTPPGRPGRPPSESRGAAPSPTRPAWGSCVPAPAAAGTCPDLIWARRSSRNPGTPTVRFDPGDGPPVRTGGLGPAVGRDPVPRHDQRGRVVHEVEQVVEPAARIGRRPTVKLGLHLRYPPPRPHRHSRCVVVGRGVTIRWRIFRHYSLHLFSIPLPPFAHVTGSPGLGLLRRLRPTPEPIGRRCAQPDARAGRDGPGRPGVVPVFTCRSLDGGGTRLGPCDIAVATPQHVTTASPSVPPTCPGSSPPP